MSERYEMTTAIECPAELWLPGEDVGEDILTGHAIILGDRYSAALVIEGTLPELKELAEYLVFLVSHAMVPTDPQD